MVTATTSLWCRHRRQARRHFHHQRLRRRLRRRRPHRRLRPRVHPLVHRRRRSHQHRLLARLFRSAPRARRAPTAAQARAYIATTRRSTSGTRASSRMRTLQPGTTLRVECTAMAARRSLVPRSSRSSLPTRQRTTLPLRRATTHRMDARPTQPRALARRPTFTACVRLLASNSPYSLHTLSLACFAMVDAGVWRDAPTIRSEKPSHFPMDPSGRW